MHEQQLEKFGNVAALLAAGISLCKVQQNPHTDGRHFVLVPQADGAVKVEYLERPDLPARRKGTVKVNDVESFIDATARYSADDSVIYASLQPAQFLTVLNDHCKGTDGDPGWRDHRVSFALQHSKEYLAWTHHNGHDKTFSQERFAYFIEDNLPDFKAPPGARMLDMALNFRAKQAVSYKGSTRLQSGSVELSYTEQTEGAAGAQGKFQIPEEFAISIPVWAGLDQKKYDFEARLRYRINSGQLVIWYDLNRPHKVVDKAFSDTVDHIEKSLAKTPMIFGTPE